MDKEEKYIEIAEKLKGLEKVEASSNFTHNLQAKIVEFESEKRKEHAKRNEETKGGFLRELFGNLQYPWLIPAAGFTILVFFIFYITYQNRNTMDSDSNIPLTQNEQTENLNKNSEITGENQTNDALKETESVKETENSSEKSEEIKGKDIAGNETAVTENNRSGKKITTLSSENIRAPERKTNENYSLKVDDRISESEDSRKEVTEEKTIDAETEESKGMVSEKDTRKMATIKPDSKSSDSAKNEKSIMNKMLLKINRIDKEDLERIQEEISK